MNLRKTEGWPPTQRITIVSLTTAAGVTTCKGESEMKRSVLAAATRGNGNDIRHARAGAEDHAGPPWQGRQPHVRTDWTIDGANVSIEYGRPSLKGRMPGKDVDPYDGREWRTGADEATTLKTDKALKFGTLSVPAGTYTLYTIPTGGTWHLMVSKKTGQWGVPYPKGEDLGRAPMTLGKAPSRRRAADVLGAGHAGRRHAPHRLGHDTRLHSVHGRLTSRGSRGSTVRTAYLLNYP